MGRLFLLLLPGLIIVALGAAAFGPPFFLLVVPFGFVGWYFGRKQRQRDEGNR